ncbi:hypothetical protein SAMN05421823_102351 [Catalinimonas alkaloidigena]|uniref:Uncharacterized protein n=1 Tax=Catalinimonas alkaloidigena TaxID=1075417 RepID=A0A1G9AMM9_9BACT|nr:hypothetical protein [Catalinimonas alkaloidigena]SDK28501.1 hypothetical protein SAMN05421823_102351 [Catalinimonas alkaloidigena]
MRSPISASFLGGMAGAVALTAVHESIRQVVPQAPRIDLVGIRAINSIIRGTDFKQPDAETKRGMALSGDLMANATFYSLAGTSWAKGVLLGLGAGLGGLILPGKLGLGDAPTNRTTETQVMTVGYYVLGGIAAVAATRALKKYLK